MSINLNKKGLFSITILQPVALTLLSEEGYRTAGLGFFLSSLNQKIGYWDIWAERSYLGHKKWTCYDEFSWSKSRSWYLRIFTQELDMGKNISSLSRGSDNNRITQTGVEMCTWLIWVKKRAPAHTHTLASASVLECRRVNSEVLFCGFFCFLSTDNF